MSQEIRIKSKCCHESLQILSCDLAVSDSSRLSHTLTECRKRGSMNLEYAEDSLLYRFWIQNRQRLWALMFLLLHHGAG